MANFNKCRLCLEIDETNLTSIMDDNGKIGTLIFLISGVKIIEKISYDSAKICDKCLENLLNAAKFREMCLESDQEFRRTSYEEEEKCWSKKLIAMQCTALPIEDEEIKCEPLIEQFCDSQDQFDVLSTEFIEEDVQAPTKRTKDKKRKYKKRKSTTEDKEGYECCICKKIFRKYSYETYRSHLRDHRKQNESAGIPCSKCNEYFLTYSSLDRHINKEHPAFEDLVCDKCGKFCANRRKMKDHLLDAHKNKKSKKEFKEKNSSKPDVPCSICGKFFKDTYYLRKHERLHNKLKPSEYLYCDLCGNKFKEKAALHTHIRFTHIEKRLFHCPHCPEGSSRGWSKKHAMQRHVKNVHLGIKEHKCDICGKEFHAQNHLKNHYRIHTGETPFACRYCDRKFIHQTDCRRHEWGHTGYKGNIKCPNCGQGFFKNSDLQSHLTRCHSTSSTFY